MNISDLNYLEVAQETNVVGGGRWKRNRLRPSAEATAEAYADAIGRRSYSETFTDAQAVSGTFSSSFSGSFAKAEGPAV